MKFRYFLAAYLLAILLPIIDTPQVLAQSRQLRDNGDRFEGLSNLEIKAESNRSILKGLLFKNTSVATINARVGWKEEVKSVSTNGFTSWVTITDFSSGLVGFKNHTSVALLDTNFLSGTWAFLQGFLHTVQGALTNIADKTDFPPLSAAATGVTSLTQGISSVEALRSQLSSLATNAHIQFSGEDLMKVIKKLPFAESSMYSKIFGSVTGFMTQQGDLSGQIFLVTVEGAKVRVDSTSLSDYDPRFIAGTNLLAQIFDPYLLANLATNQNSDLIQHRVTIPADLIKIAIAPLLTIKKVTPDLNMKISHIALESVHDFTPELSRYKVEPPIRSSTWALNNSPDTIFSASIDEQGKQDAMSMKAKINLRLMDDPRIPSAYLYHADIQLFDAHLYTTQIMTGLLTNIVSSKKGGTGKILITQKRLPSN